MKKTTLKTFAVPQGVGSHNSKHNRELLSTFE